MTRSQKKGQGISRRQILKAGLAGVTASLAFPFVKTGSADERKIVVRDPGGPYTKAFEKAFYEPFYKETGIKVIGVQAQHDPTGMIKAMVDNANYTWDGSLLSKPAHQILVNHNYLEPIHSKSGPGPNVRKIPENMRTGYLIGNDVYATLIAYREDTMGKNPPLNWRDFWDVKGKKGARALRKHPFDTLEEALLADGVAPQNLYPLDFERAFKSLDKIKAQVKVWWTGGAQTSQLLKTGEIDCVSTYNARAQVAVDDGAPVKLVWDQALYSYEGWAILKGTPKANLVREFIEFAAQGKQQALFTTDLAYGPTNPEAFKFVDKHRAEVLPTNPKYLPKMIPINTEYWGKHEIAANDRFNTWLLS
ncbi:MAG: ABC transporter substrate-binding protein [Thermodesulfobacteriota bacterium]